ncbi:DUF7144 family membrane protein [Geodermatophilus sabuli]|uniref:DUF7144 domain-containing protein n=1 Tax=Geodermatophilus sabuli TaxID=1564158 RepID=A0A285EGL8_9ACTN|nr:hypothetical protein [Geodermatophilus sabuli]MBB3084461.1 hypothetical protein [Geodermatophilus sabuli]SNX97344.1 hypothetical protein SAMN06893097_106294 [Geodermatophilus sabuli]
MGSPPPPGRTPSAAWQNWAYAGAGIMALMGVFWALLGVVALLDAHHVTVRTNELLVLESHVAWGWVHLIGGLLALTAGAGILWGGHRWARRAAVIVAVLGAVVNFGFLAASPVWSTSVIALGVVAVYALTVHGRELDER